jgi:hypothetical protein
MADFIMDQEEQIARENPVGISECLVDPKRRMVAMGLGRVDDRDAISETLMNEVRPKAIPLDLFYPLDDDENFSTHGYGQSALIRKGDISRSPGDITFHCTVVPVTAKRNLRKVQRRADILTPNRATLNVEVGEANFVSDDLGWQPSQADEMDIREG